MSDVFFIGDKENQANCAGFSRTTGTGMFIRANKKDNIIDKFDFYSVKKDGQNYLRKIGYPIGFDGDGFDVDKYKRVLGITLTPDYRKLIDYLFGGPGKIVSFANFVSVPANGVNLRYDNIGDIIKIYTDSKPDCVIVDLNNERMTSEFLYEMRKLDKNEQNAEPKKSLKKILRIPVLRLGEFCG
ncbi:hypothetical protein HYZ41_02900 [archaeon]|nr:hypothetical protein [archaeon]